MAIVELRSRPERLRQEQADVLRQALLPFQAGEMSVPVRELLAAIDRQTVSKSRWTFVMLSPSQNAIVVNYLVEHSSRPMLAVRMWALCFEHLRVDTGEIMLSREQIAEKMGDSPNHISEIMSELVRFGAISRRLEKVDGLRGRIARYYMNPRVATHLAGKERDDAQTSAPLLHLIEGGAATNS